jgi:hypothetical protein
VSTDEVEVNFGGAILESRLSEPDAPLEEEETEPEADGALDEAEAG